MIKVNKHFFYILHFIFMIVTIPFSQTTQKRDRGESFYRSLNSNTSGSGNWWIQLSGIGHIWDDAPIALDSSSTKAGSKWISNVRAFPEIRTHVGLYDIFMLSLESRVLGNFWSPGWFSGSCKLTWPNNKELRLHGYAIDFRYFYQVIESGPSLGGYIGFMPEGFVSKGHNFETRLIYELDLTPKISNFPIRLLVNNGLRLPLRKDRKDFYQILFDISAIYSGNGFDFFAAYSLEAFNNFTNPIVLNTDESKRIIVFFPENPMYAIFGGSVRYDNGLNFSVSVPILLSTNIESKMTIKDLENLNRNRSDLYPIEVKNNIRDPFDPWFVKWKIVASIGFPIRFKMTSAEMMRNYLILKNRQEVKKINIDNKLNKIESDTKKSDEDEDRKRLEKIKKRKEQIQ